jgi:glyoxylase-like metal-dependent hydrolase (beta-lactamase superfamily II)
MFLETVRSEGLGHLSYIFGDKGKAAVVDPRRDCEVYIDIAYREGARITHIFETHRNEDYVSGSRELARRTGAKMFHGEDLPFAFGDRMSHNRGAVHWLMRVCGAGIDVAQDAGVSRTCAGYRSDFSHLNAFRILQ